MMDYVTLDEVKHHLRYELDDHDSDVILTAYIESAEQAVNAYITDSVDGTNEHNIKVAVLLMVGYLDDNRNATHQGSGNYLPPQVRQLLSPYRTPTI